LKVYQEHLQAGFFVPKILCYENKISLYSRMGDCSDSELQQTELEIPQMVENSWSKN
jgi:hypothetical protein